MLAMKKYVILAGVLGAALAQAQSTPAAAVKPVSVARATVSPAHAPAAVASPRQLNAEERAELRRQLYQFRRLSAKAP